MKKKTLKLVKKIGGVYEGIEKKICSEQQNIPSSPLFLIYAIEESILIPLPPWHFPISLCDVEG